jgi:predicted DNA binding CopG/RHH family protein
MIGTFMDEEEKRLFELMESDAFVLSREKLTPERKAMLQVSAEAVMDKQRTKISLRIPNADLERLKAKASAEGMPYQTLINSILHKAVS